MKKIILFLLLLLIGAFAVFSYQQPAGSSFSSFFYQSACDKPLAVTIGQIDPKYKLSQNEVLADINQAIDIWNKGFGRKLLVYDQNANLPINFIYDERQNLIDQTKSSASQVTSQSNSVKQTDQDLTAQRIALDDQYLQLQKDAQTLKQNYEDFKQEVDYWNSQGGAPTDEYQKLQEQQNRLKADSDNLNSRILEHQQAAKDYNAQIDPFLKQVQQLKGDAANLQQLSQTLNSAISQDPEEGQYSFTPESQKIDIFFIDNQNKLIETLAHEMGHALGLDHNKNPKSIMYPFIQGSLTPTDTDIADLTEICRPKSYPELFTQRAGQIINHYSQLLQIYSSKN